MMQELDAGNYHSLTQMTSDAVAKLFNLARETGSTVIHRLQMEAVMLKKQFWKEWALFHRLLL